MVEETAAAAPAAGERLDGRRLRSTVGLVLGILGPRANLAVSGVLLTLLVSSRVNSAVAITFALSANRFIGWLAYPLLGRASDHSHGRAGRRAPFMAAGLVVMGVCTYAYPSIPGYWLLVLLIVGVKVASVVAGLTNLAVVPEIFGKSRTVKALALVGVLGALVSLSIKGTVLATWRTSDPHTWALAFHLAGVIMMASALAILVLVREAPAARVAAELEHRRPHLPWREELRRALERPNARLLAAGILVFWAGFSATGYLAIVYFQKVQHAGASVQTVAGWVAGVPVIVFGAIGGYLISKHVSRKAVAVLTPLLGAGVSLVQFESTHIWQTVVLAFVGAPLFCAFIISFAPMLVELLPTSGGLGELLGKLVAPFSVMALAFAFVAAWAVDASADYRVIWLFPAAAGVIQAGLMCALRIAPEARLPRLEGLPERLIDWSVDQMQNRDRRLFAGSVTVEDADGSSLFEVVRHIFDPEAAGRAQS